MTKTRVAMLVVVTLVVGGVAMLLNEPDSEPSAPVAVTSSAVEPASVTRAVPRSVPVVPPASPNVEPAAVPVVAPVAAVPVPALAQQQQWLPPPPTDLIFDLNGDHHVEPDEQERAAELLERGHQFASNRSPDGTYPILKPDFRGSGRLFRLMDTDADGALTEREFLAFEADSIRELRRYDQNADGALSKAEFGHLDTRFDYLDDDHDGALYAWEITLMRGRGKW